MTRSDMGPVLEGTCTSDSPASLEGQRAGVRTLELQAQRVGAMAMRLSGRILGLSDPPPVKASIPTDSNELRLARRLTVLFRPEMPHPRDPDTACCYAPYCTAHTVGEYFDPHPGPYTRSRSGLAAELRAYRC